MPVCLRSWGKRFLTSVCGAAPVILFFLVLFVIVYVLFGLQYSIIVSVVTTFFQVRYKKSTNTVYQHLWLALFGSLLYFLAVLSSWNLFFCVLLNLSVPFLLAFTLSSQFNPKGYFSYSMFFVFLALMPPENQEEFVTELFVFWFCMIFLTAAVWLYGRFFLKSAALPLTLRNMLLEMSELVLLLPDLEKKEEIKERFSHLVREACALPHHQNFFAVHTRKNKIYDMTATLLQRFSYLIQEDGWREELDEQHTRELKRLSRFLAENAVRLDSISLEYEIRKAHSLLDSMALPEGSVRIFCRSLLHMMILLLEAYREPHHSVKNPPGLNWRRVIQRLKIRLSPDSFEMRFALRLSIVLTITCSIGQLLPITRSYWIPLNAFLLLQPSSEDSSYRMKTRPVGTLIGCIVEFLALPFLPDTGSQILFALVMISFMYCAAPGTWYQPIFSTCYALTLTSMTLNETTAIQLRLLYLCAAVLSVFIVNRFFFPIRRDKLFQYNLRSLLQLHDSYWEMIQKELTAYENAPVSSELLTCFHVIYEECMDYTKKIPAGFRRNRLEHLLITLWHMFSELEQLYFLVHTGAVSEEEKPASLSLIAVARKNLQPARDQKERISLERTPEFQNAEVSHVFRKYFKHAGVVMKYAHELTGLQSSHGIGIVEGETEKG